MAEKTFQYQDSLPHLPVPKLQDTLQKYLRSVKAIVPENQYNATREIVEEFGKSGGLGEELTQKLKEMAKSHDNWLEDYWLRYAYLGVREPLMIVCSPVVDIVNKPVGCLDDQLRLTAKVVSGLLQHNQQIQSQTLPVDKVAGRPLSMEQYKNIFSAYRVPGEKLDSCQLFSTQNPQPPNLIIAYKNEFFSVDVLKNDQYVTQEDIYQIFKEITEKYHETGKGVGILTGTNRDLWYETYTELIKDQVNASNIEKIAKGLLVLAFDSHEVVPVDADADSDDVEKHLSTICHDILTGGGINGDACNRWFDKRLQIMVGNQGFVGLIGEHSNIDGTTVLRLCQTVSESVDGPDNHERSQELPPIHKLEWDLSSSLENRIEQAKEHANSVINNIKISILNWDQYGKEFVKSNRMSPDSFLQMVVQVAYYKLHNEFESQYESGATKLYLHGRTETIRSTSLESAAFCKAFLSDTVSNDEKKMLLKKAVEGHKNYALQASMGQGWDRHLFGMKIWALENGMATPEIFNDPSYNTLSQFKISTSQVTLSSSVSVACFAPAAEDGYGISYNIKSDFFIISITSFNSSSQASAVKFNESLKQVLHDIKVLLES